MVAVPAVLKAIVDLFSAPGPLVLPVFLLLGYALMRFGGGVFTELRDVVFARVALRTVADFTVSVFSRLQQLAPGFTAAGRLGALARDVERGTAGVGFLLGTGLFTLLPTLVEIVSVVLILVMGYSIWFAAIVTITFIAYFSYTTVLLRARRLSAPIERAGLARKRADGRQPAQLRGRQAQCQRSAGIGPPVARAGGVDAGRRAQPAFAVAPARRPERHHRLRRGGSHAVGRAAGRRDMTVGDLVLVNAYIIQICLPLNTLGLIFRQAKEAFVNAERVCDLLRYPPETGTTPRCRHCRRERAKCASKAWISAMSSGRQILWGVDLTVPAGTTLAVVGGSGSGKSTLGRLLLRFYDPDAGRILINGHDLRAVNVRSLRRVVGIVPQDTMLFNETIAYNIAYSRPDATRDQIVQAARGARIHDFIESLPGGYETPVGERGVKLSGGERQRVGIARAILKDPTIMVFDEATSALDTERAIQAELEWLSRRPHDAHHCAPAIDHCACRQYRGPGPGQGRRAGTPRRSAGAPGHLRADADLAAAAVRLGRGNGKDTRQPVNLVAVVAGVLDGSREVAQDKGVNVYTLIGNEAARITGDPSALQQLVWDLCLHAMRGHAAGRAHRDQPCREGSLTALSVTDGRTEQDADPALLPTDGMQNPTDGLRVAAALDPAELAVRAQRQGGTFHQYGRTLGRTLLLRRFSRARHGASTAARGCQRAKSERRANHAGGRSGPRRARWWQKS